MKAKGFKGYVAGFALALFTTTISYAAQNIPHQCIERVRGSGQLSGNASYNVRVTSSQGGGLYGAIRFTIEGGAAVRSTQLTGYSGDGGCRTITFDFTIEGGGEGVGTGTITLCDNAGGATADTVSVTLNGSFASGGQVVFSGSVTKGDVTLTRRSCD